MADLKLRILMEAVDRVTAPIVKIRNSTAGLQQALGKTTEKLRNLERSAKQMDRFRALKAEAKSNSEALEAAQARAQGLAVAMQGADRVTRSMRREFAQATAEVNRLKDAQQRGTQELQQLRRELRSAGVDTGKLASEQRRVKTEIAQATAQANRQSAALEKLAARTKAMAAARHKMERTQAAAGSMAGAGAAGLATGGGALMAAGSAAMIGIDFEAMMSKVGALAKVEKTSEAFQKLEKQAFDLGATTSFSASDAAEAMANLAMSGFNAEKILGVMPSMLNLAKAGTTELGMTASITANIMSGFGLQASQMGDVGDVLVATFTNSNTNLEMLGETMKYVAPIAKAAGYSLGDMATLAGLLGNVGIQGSEAGTAMRASLIRLAAPPKDAKDKLEELGVATKTVTGDMRPMASVLADIAEKTKAMGNAQKIETFSKIFGVEAAAAMTELVSQAGSNGIKEFANTIKQAHGLNDKISAQMADNAKGDIDNLSSALEGVAIIVTKINTQPLRDLTTWAANTVTAIGDWMLANEGLTATLTQIAIVVAGLIAAGGVLAITVAGVLGPFAILRFTLTALGLHIPSVAGGFLALGRAIFAGVIPALWSMTAALLANPITWVVAAIAAAATVLIVGWEPVAGFFAGLWGQVSGLFSTAWGAIKSALGFDPVAAIAPYWQPVADFFTGLWGRLVPIVAGAWDGIKAALSFTPLGLIVANWQPIADFFTGLWGQVVPIVAGAWDSIKAVLGFTPLGLIIANWQPIADFFTRLWDGILAKINGVWAAIEQKVASIKGVVEWAGSTWDSLFGSSGPKPAVAGAAAAPAPMSIVPVPAAPAAAAAPASSSASSPAEVRQPINITVNAAPGMNAEEVAREVRRQLEAAQARDRSSARSALYDKG